MEADRTAACLCVGGPVVRCGPKEITWECSRCHRRRRLKRETVTLIDLTDNCEYVGVLPREVAT